MFAWDRTKGVLMNRARQFRLLTIGLLLALVWLPGESERRAVRQHSGWFRGVEEAIRW